MSRARKKSAQAAVALETKETVFQRSERFLERRAVILTAALVLTASIRIISTYTVFSHTSDEPAHLACGMQWLDQGVYLLETQHPPLTRIMAALGPYLDGARSSGQSEMFAEGAAILYSGQGAQYDRRLALSRAGNLPFFWLACAMVFLWGKRALGGAGAVIAVLIFTMIPTVLAHAGLATTDMGATASLAAAAYALVAFAGNPGPKTAGSLGLAAGLMALCKFSSLAFYPAAVILALALWLYLARPAARELRLLFLRRLPWLGLAGLLAFVVIWAGYRFSFGKTVWTQFPLPFPELYSGLKEVADHNERGHLSYFMGELRMNGWWAFFPVLIAVKLPISVLTLAAVGLWQRAPAASSRWPFWILVAIPVAILATALPSNINIGIRHILPMLPFVAIIAAAGTLWLASQGSSRPWARWGVVAATVWLSDQKPA